MRLEPTLLVAFPMFVLSIVVHECAHALVASWRGDPTAKDGGRLNLNPWPHLDPIGTVILPGLLLATHAPVVFGWGQPVPVERARLRNPTDDPALVALAGPLASVLLALAFAGLARIVPATGFWAPLGQVAYAAVAWNCAIALLNRIPVPPRDGAWVLMRFLPLRHVIALHHFRVVALAIVAVLLVSPATSETLLHAPLRIAVGACLGLFGVSPRGAS